MLTELLKLLCPIVDRVFILLESFVYLLGESTHW